MFIVPLIRRSAHATADDAFSPALDVVESAQGWSVTLDLPGVAKEDVKVAIDGPHITVEAEVRKEAERKDGERLVHRERTVARFARSFKLPADVEQAESGAKLDHGVLTLTLAKKRANLASHLTVN